MRITARDAVDIFAISNFSSSGGELFPSPTLPFFSPAHSVGGGNAGAVARRILEKVAESEGERRVSYTQDRYVFHIEQADGLLYLCMADAQFGREDPIPPPTCTSDDEGRVSAFLL